MDNTLQDSIDKYLSRDLLFALHNREFLFDYFESMLTEFEDAPTEFYKYHDSFMDAIHVSITEHPNFRLFESLEDYGKHILERYVRITSDVVGVEQITNAIDFEAFGHSCTRGASTYVFADAGWVVESIDGDAI